MAESDPGVLGGEVPVDLPLVSVGLLLPGGEFGVEDREIIDAPVKALAGERGELDLGDVEPGAVFGGVVDFQALCQREGLVGLERLIGEPTVWVLRLSITSTTVSASGCSWVSR